MKMLFPKQTTIFTTTVVILLLFTKFHQTNGNNDQNVFESTSNGLSGEMNLLKDNLRRVNFELDSLHNKLHLQTDMINDIKTQILHTDVKGDQCESSELFDEIDNKLHKIKQNLHKVINNNDDKHLDKMDSILQKVKASKGCHENDDTEQLEEIKTQILEKLQKFNQYVERLELLEKKFEKLDKYDENDTSILTYSNMPDMDSIINQINSKLLSQEEELQRFEEHLSEMQNISSTVESHLKTRKEKAKQRCSKGKCILYKLVEMDKSLNLTKIV